jgi:hypothetical protein
MLKARWNALTWRLYRKRRYLKELEVAEQLDRDSPLTRNHPAFGTFTYNRRTKLYEINKDWNGITIELSIISENPDDPAFDLIAKSAHRLWDDEAGWLQKLKAYAAQEMLASANDWQEEKGPVSHKEFCDRISIESLSFWDEDEFEAWFGDGDLFWGHWICVSSSLKDGPNHAALHG